MRATEQKWAERVHAWRESGQTARAFSTGRDFSAGGLRHWAYRLKRRGAATGEVQAPALAAAREVPQSVRVARVERSVAPKSAALVVEIGPGGVHVPGGAARASVRAPQ